MNTAFQGNPPRRVPSRSGDPVCRAFTLIELLVVISIIGILSAFVISGISQMSPKKAISTTRAKRAQVVTMIESYRNDRGSYPPDNPNNPGTNTLFYELTGVVFTNNLVTPANATFTSPLVPSVNLNSNDLWTVFGTFGIVNSALPGARLKSYFAEIKSDDYRSVNIAGRDVSLLTAPKQAQIDPAILITWKYDASSNNRRNPATYDLWADIIIKGKQQRIDN
jgi:prepilin-type N-terminal cleavage/methylation domain-containing protein